MKTNIEEFSVENLPRERWDRLLRDDSTIYLGSNFLTKSGDENIRFALVTSGQKDIGAFVWYEYAEPSFFWINPQYQFAGEPNGVWEVLGGYFAEHEFSQSPVSLWAPISSEPPVLPSKDYFPLIVVGSLLERDNQLLVDPEFDINKFVNVVINFCNKKAKAVGAKSILFPQYSLIDTMAIAQYSKDIVAVSSFARHIMNPPENFEVYLQQLIKKYRKVARRRRRKFESAGFTSEYIDVREHAETIIKLVSLHDQKWGSTNADEAVVEIELPEMRAIGLRYSDKIVGVQLFLSSGNRRYLRHIGLDYNITDEGGGYFGLTLDLFEKFMEEKVTHVDDGITFTKVKASFGERPESRFCLLKSIGENRDISKIREYAYPRSIHTLKTLIEICERYKFQTTELIAALKFQNDL